MDKDMKYQNKTLTYEADDRKDHAPNMQMTIHGKATTLVIHPLLVPKRIRVIVRDGKMGPICWT